jgi:hypothetical protein
VENVSRGSNQTIEEINTDAYVDVDPDVNKEKEDLRTCSKRLQCVSTAMMNPKNVSKS